MDRAPASILDEEVEDSPADQQEDQIVQSRAPPARFRTARRTARRRPAAARPAPAAAIISGTTSGSRISGPIRSRARELVAIEAISAPVTASADVGEQQDRQQRQQAGGVVEEEEREDRHRRTARAPSGRRAAPPPWRRTARCRRPARAGSPSKPPCSRSATKIRLIARIAANSIVTSRTPAARLPRGGPVEPEAEEHEGRRREQQPSPAPTGASAARPAGPCRGWP